MKRLLFLLAAVGCIQVRHEELRLPMAHVVADTTVRQKADTTPPDSTGFVNLLSSPITTGQVVRYGYVDPRFRDSVLAKAWNPGPQYETGWCVTRWSIFVNDALQRDDSTDVFELHIDSTFVVWEMKPSPTIGNNVQSFYNCPFGMPRGHVHPPATCTDDDDKSSCKVGGWNAYQCQPSENDIENLLYYGSPFGVVLCGPNQVRFFFPSELLKNRWKGARPPPEKVVR